jgi:hypothetical protein
MSEDRMSGYNLLHVGNPFWSIAEAVDGSARTLYGPGILAIVSLGGFAMLLLNLRSILEEVRLVRAASPTRVAEEEAALKSLHVGTPGHVPRSPWDEIE